MSKENVTNFRTQLRVYTALGSEPRLNAFLVISKDAPISFADIRKSVRIAPGLLAYHLGLLKAAGLVKCRYGREGKSTSSYRLTLLGDRVLGEMMLGAAGGNRTPSDTPGGRPEPPVRQPPEPAPEPNAELPEPAARIPIPRA